jgi:hypothetical protein
MSVKPDINNPGRVVSAYHLDADGNPQTAILRDGTVIDIEEAGVAGDTRGLGILGVDGSNQARFFKVNDTGKLDVVQTELFSLFYNILKQLEKINIHLSIMTDNEIQDWETKQ